MCLVLAILMLCNKIQGIKDPLTRGTVALLLGCIHRSAIGLHKSCIATKPQITRCIGGMRMQAFVSSTVEVLQNLCREPHPTVFIPALHSLSVTVDAVGNVLVAYGQWNQH